MTSIEFRPVCTFTSPHFSTQKSSRRAAREGVVTAAVALVVPQRGFLFVGLTDGKILCWEIDQRCNDRRGREGSQPRVLDDHRGGIRCMLFVDSLWQGVMLTGAADRCIKMWDLSDPRGAIPCVHSLYGHGGTILAIEFGSDMLLSSSTDGFMCIWRDQSPAKLLRFPAYTIRQRLAPDARVLSQGHRAPKDTWFLSLSIREGEAPSIFAGDSDGYVHVYRPDTMQEGSDIIFLLAHKMKIHELGIPKIMVVPMESFIFTLSYDQTFKTLDSLSGHVIFEESNQCNVIFNGLAWDSTCQDVIVADAKGNIGFYNLYMEACVAWKNFTEDPIIQIHYDTSTHRLLLLSPHSLRVVDVVRGVKFSELSEHEGPIVAMASRPTSQGGLVYTASMDNTVRMWDADSLECIKTLREKKQEITAMVYLPRANVIITGHENSDIKLWSIDSQEEALLRTVTGQSVHENTISSMIWADSSLDEAQKSNGFVAGDSAAAGYETLIAGSYDCQLSFWKVTLTSDGTAMAKFERAFRAHDDADDEILAVAHCCVDNAVFSGGNSGVIRKWGFWGLKQLRAEYEGHTDAILCFATDANFLYSGSVDKTVRIWETSQGYQLKVVSVHDVAVQSLLVFPESGFVASCAFDGRVCFWDPQIGRKDANVTEIQTYEQPEEFRALAYVELNRQILVGCESGKIVAFPLPADDNAQDASTLPPDLRGVDTPPDTARGGDEDEQQSTLELLHSKVG
eukprot:TRINITY_DN2861_c0_g1_i2.p1 TRINITY_DN2861_c0_g1~~TRINITY_DN2861_c0_g1_i2.p1  ORF type:complete len:737 (-),score=128.30 TRINITY_DN2861_c0_g1_i2:176-2386(-)